jgi:sulfate adenylyltransferase
MSAVSNHCPNPRELDDLELLLNGAMAPQRTFDDLVTLDVPPHDGGIELVDPEGLPLARLGADDELTALARPAYGAFRALHLTPAEVGEAHEGALFVPVDTWLDEAALARIGEARDGRPVVLLALTGTGTPRDLNPLALIRASLAAAQELDDAHVVAVPLARHRGTGDGELRSRVIANYAASGTVLDGLGGGDARPASVDRVVRAEQRRSRGVVVFFTGLSGSGKSTLARALTDRILEQGEHTVTSLDGDVVRRNLSAGLSFSREDRETNIRRIGWVAAEISRHGGVAICSPIAPFDATRKAVRQMVADAGGEFVLVHVATSLEECERRDRKGLYAKARAGEIPDFTGISSPYDVPDDASVVVDTTGRSIEDALDDVLAVLPFDLGAGA